MPTRHILTASWSKRQESSLLCPLGLQSPVTPPTRRCHISEYFSRESAAHQLNLGLSQTQRTDEDSSAPLDTHVQRSIHTCVPKAGSLKSWLHITNPPHAGYGLPSKKQVLRRVSPALKNDLNKTKILCRVFREKEKESDTKPQVEQISRHPTFQTLMFGRLKSHLTTFTCV